MVMLTNLADVARRAGLKVVEVDGWKQRGRPTGGFAPVGVLCHHTATSKASRDDDVVRLLVQGRSDLPGPLCQLGLGRDGTVYVVAAGRANHAGKAKSSGSVASGDGNALYIGIEAMNDGVGEPWPQVQYDAYVTLCAALSKHVTGNSVRTVRGHKETSVTGKIDPTFDMDAFRARVEAKMAEPDRPKRRRLTLRAGTWNLRVGRRPHVVADEVESLLDDYGLDVLCVQEAGRYLKALRRRLRGDYHVCAGLLGGDSRTAVIVRDGLRPRQVRSRLLSGLGWERGKGRPGLHEPRHLVSVRIGFGRGVRVASVHLPPTPHAKRLPGRGLAHSSDVRIVARMARRWTRWGPWLMAGDWNARPDSSYVYDLTRHGTAHGSGIDWVLAHDLDIDTTTRVDHGNSDHRPRLFTVRSTR